MKKVLAVPGFALRLGYFAVVPFLLVIASVRLPVLGAIINLVVFLVLYLLRDLLPGVGTQRLFRRFFRLENYYREHPPKPFLYYALFPLFAPYWLLYRPARREIFLYRRLSSLGLVIVCVVKGLDYYRNWQPAIPWNTFLNYALLALFLEFVVFMTMIIPIATTVATYRLAGARRRLMVLGATALLSLGFALVGVKAAKRPQVRSDVAARMWLRTDSHQEASARVLEAALTRALSELPKPAKEMAISNIKKPIDGRPEESARRELASFYRPDEAAAFFLFLTETKANERALVLYAFGDNKKRRRSVWRALVVNDDGDAARFTADRDDFDARNIP